MARAKSIASLTAVGLFLFLCVGVLAGQVRTGNIYGRITDKEGMGLSQVKVTLNAPGVSPLFSETRGSGLYHFISLSPGGQYAITAELEGYKGATRTGLVVQVGVNTECDIILERISAVISKKRAAILAFDRLVAAPSPLTTRDFLLFVSGEVEGDITAILDYIFGPDIREFIPDVRNFSIVLSEMLNGDIYAARSAIRILGYVKNEWQKPPGQKLPILLRIGGAVGELIRANPSLFLRACLEERDSPGLKERDIPYGYPPFILYMKKTMLSYEMEMRKQALQTVDDPRLQSIKDECLDLVEKGTQVFEAYGNPGPRPWESEVTEIDEAPEAVKSVLLEMMARPSPENMMRVLALFDERKDEHRFLEAALFPLISISGPNGPDGPPRSIRPDPLEIIFHEAKCGNPAAIRIVFTALPRAFRAWDDLASQQLFGFISDLILMNPAVFIENAAHFSYLESELLDTRPITYLDAICGTYNHDAWSRTKETILSRRIAAMGVLDMPEHRELIGRCIRLLEKHLAASTH